MLPQSTQINKAEVTDTKPDQMSDQPEEEYGFMEPMTLDSDDEDEVENVPKSVPEIVPEIVPNRQKSPEPENDAQDEEDVLNIESITIDSENKDEVKIEVKEDKTQQVLGFPTGQNFFVPRDSGTDMLLLSRDKRTAGQGHSFCPGTKGQWDKLKILPRAGTASQNLGQDAGRDNHYFSVKIWCRRGQLLFFAVLERFFLL